MDDDFEAIIARKRKRLIVGAGSTAGFVALLFLVYAALPGVWDATVGPLIGIKARIHPDALAMLEQGMEPMLRDTAAGYDEALLKFEEARKIDPLYPEAIAFSCIANVFRGSDVQAQGQALRSRGEELISEIKALSIAKNPPKGAKARAAKLRKEANEINERATKFYETGGDFLRRAESQLKKALRQFSGEPMMVVASGIYLATDPDRVEKASKHLKTALRLYGATRPIDLSNPPDIWTPYLHGVVEGSRRTKGADYDKAFVAALNKEPNFQRARYAQAVVLQQSGKTPEAKALAKEILKAQPEHSRAKNLLSATEAPKKPAEPAKSKKGKGSKKQR